MKRKYKPGTVWRIAECSGPDSGKRVTVIPHFYWREADDGMYAPPGPDEVPVRFEDSRRGFMFRNRLLPLNPSTEGDQP